MYKILEDTECIAVMLKELSVCTLEIISDDFLHHQILVKLSKLCL